ncbi:hypothetical protein, partial [Streptomyces sp. NPDC037389]|uniref:hypothetical protein n=1 Tax=Streptomyces sp. NPDC037389 TaxID=3155369 RepID=UPI0033C83CBF
MHVLVVDADGRRRILDAPDDRDESAGFENRRTRVWRSPVVRSLGAVLLPDLAERDLEVPPDQVPALLSECLLLREKPEEVVVNTEPVRSGGAAPVRERRPSEHPRGGRRTRAGAGRRSRHLVTLRGACVLR